MLMLQQMLVLFIIMIIGYIAAQKDMMDERTCKKLSGIVVNIANPALILSGAIGDTAGIKGRDLWLTALVSASMYLFLLIIAALLPKLLGVKGSKTGIYRVMTVFSNIGFMGFPIISAMLGSKALLFASVFLIPYNILIYTYGIGVMQNEKERRFHIMKIFNIGVVFSLLAICIFAGDVTLPEWCKKVISMLSSLTAPISMMVIGASFTTIRIKTLFSDKQLLIFSAVKLLLIPIPGSLLLHHLIGNEMLIKVGMYMLCMPVGSMTAMLAQEYGGEYETAARGVAVTTVLSVITLPFVVSLF